MNQLFSAQFWGGLQHAHLQLLNFPFILLIHQVLHQLRRSIYYTIRIDLIWFNIRRWRTYHINWQVRFYEQYYSWGIHTVTSNCGWIAKRMDFRAVEAARRNSALKGIAAKTISLSGMLDLEKRQNDIKVTTLKVGLSGWSRIIPKHSSESSRIVDSEFKPKMPNFWGFPNLN